MTTATFDTSIASPERTLVPLVSLALRRGVHAAPFGAVAGALIGLAGGDNAENGLAASEMALVMAAIFGFALAPALVASVGVARRLRHAGLFPGVPGAAATIGAAALVGGGWAAIGGLVTFAAGTLTALNLNVGGLVMTTAVGGVAVGAACGVIVVLASLTRRR